MAWFRKGQLVAVRHLEQDPWIPAVFVTAEEDEDQTLYKARGFGRSSFTTRWRYCVPAQDIWPWLAKFNARIVRDGMG